MQLPRFDPALGTLIKVILDLEATTDSGSIAWDNEGASPSSVTLGIGASVTATAPSALTLVAVPVQTGSDSVTGDNDGTADFIGDDAFTVIGGSGSDDDSDELLSGFTPYLATFFGETFDVNIATSVYTSVSTSGGFGPIDPMPGIASGTVCVTYEYEPAAVPEPSTIALALGSAVAMAVIRRRRS